MKAASVEPQAGDRTPWGTAESADVLCEGVVRFSTNRHGGYWVSAEKLSALPPALRECETFAGRGWYEEDVDAGLVVLGFPNHFDDQAVWIAIRSMRAHGRHAGALRYIDSDDGASVRERAGRFETLHGQLCLAGGMHHEKDGMTVVFMRIGDGRTAWVRGLTIDQAYVRDPVDVTIYGDRVTWK